MLARRVTWTFSLWQWGLIALAIALAMIITGCGTPHPQEGGVASMTIPPTEPATLSLHQPENPEGVSEITYEESRTILHPDGRVETHVKKSGTKVGGSQDYARILKEYSKTEYFKGLMVGLTLFGAAFFAYRKDWPLVALALAAGGALSIFVVWWAGAIGIAVATALYVAFKMALPLPPEIL